jgi:hypothetical protein
VRNAQRRFWPVSVTALLFVLLGYIATGATAQERDPATRRGQAEHRGGPRGHRGAPGPGSERPDRHGGRFPGTRLFQQLPEDEGPLTPDERLELLAFLRAHVPGMHRALEELRARDPAKFEKRLEDAAPRLRQLRRIFERDSELGALVVQHSENLHRMRRARWAWRTTEDPEARARISAAVRRMIAQNLRIETLVLDDRVEQLVQQRDPRIEAEIERWQSNDFDAAGESEDVRDLVEAWQAAATDEQRQALEDALRRISSERVDREIAALRDRAARLRENAVEEVDQRMQYWVEQAERGPRAHPDSRRGPGRGREDPDRDRRP